MPLLKEDLEQKMILLTGPRQVGKTYLSRQLMKNYIRPVYLNFDDINQALVINKTSWPIDTDFLILDELHKMPGWKGYLKGLYDTKDASMALLVTGSARLETFRQSG